MTQLVAGPYKTAPNNVKPCNYPLLPYYWLTKIEPRIGLLPTMTKAKKTRTRLSPEVRKELILDHAANVIAAEGVSALSMERLGREAGVSKSLVYAYYPSMKGFCKPY